ncbi:MAG: ion transporter [Alphaproteobacteria bacterium]|jgi:voltage-gated sodium channel|nr:ion transporter [Alphaproteobacteria bacterium]
MIGALDTLSDSLRKIIVTKVWDYSVIVLILINTIVLGMETYPALMESHGVLLKQIDQMILYLFVIEISCRLIVYRSEFFTQPWSFFDFLVVSIALVPSQDAFSALRAARALRVLRMISIFPKLRGVIEGLIKAVPGICAIGAVMAIIICVFGLMASKLYGADYPDWFGNLHLSVFSLFQIMTLEGWPDIVRTVMEEKPFAWIFFVIYILIATFSILNLFIAVVVEAMQRNHEVEEDAELDRLDVINRKLDVIVSKLSEKL